MQISKGGNDLIIYSPAKVNLFLEIIGPRKDGFHDLETVMDKVNLYDILRISPVNDYALTLRCDHPDVPVNDSNLILKAAEALRKTSGVLKGASFSLTKNIPIGGGLGGGSSNCAAALVGLNEFWNLELSKSELHQLAAQMGSDINFFLEDGAAVCTGRGEIVNSIQNHLKLHYLLFQPSFSVSTAQIFQAVGNFLTPILKDVTIFLKSLDKTHLNTLSQNLFNRLDGPVFDLYPELLHLRGQIEAKSSRKVHLSGSGSTLFLLCFDANEAKRLEQIFCALETANVFRVESTID